MALVKGFYGTELATTDANPSRSNSTTRDSDKSCDSNVFTIHSDGELQSQPSILTSVYQVTLSSYIQYKIHTLTIYLLSVSESEIRYDEKKWYFVTKIVLTYCENNSFKQ